MLITLKELPRKHGMQQQHIGVIGLLYHNTYQFNDQ